MESRNDFYIYYFNVGWRGKDGDVLSLPGKLNDIQNMAPKMAGLDDVSPDQVHIVALHMPKEEYLKLTGGNTYKVTGTIEKFLAENEKYSEAHRKEASKENKEQRRGPTEAPRR